MQADVQIRKGESRIYVNHHRGTGYAVLDGETGMCLNRVPIGRSPRGIAVGVYPKRLASAEARKQENLMG